MFKVPDFYAQIHKVNTCYNISDIKYVSIKNSKNFNKIKIGVPQYPLLGTWSDLSFLMYCFKLVSITNCDS